MVQHSPASPPDATDAAWAARYVDPSARRGELPDGTALLIVSVRVHGRRFAATITAWLDSGVGRVVDFWIDDVRRLRRRGPHGEALGTLETLALNWPRFAAHVAVADKPDAIAPRVLGAIDCGTDTLTAAHFAAASNAAIRHQVRRSRFFVVWPDGRALGNLVGEATRSGNTWQEGTFDGFDGAAARWFDYERPPWLARFRRTLAETYTTAGTPPVTRPRLTVFADAADANHQYRVARLLTRDAPQVQPAAGAWKLRSREPKRDDDADYRNLLITIRNAFALAFARKWKQTKREH